MYEVQDRQSREITRHQQGTHHHALTHVDHIDRDAEPGKFVFFGREKDDATLRLVGRPAAEDPDLIIIVHAMPAEWTKGRKW